MNLFELGLFKLASGRMSSYKIECDALTDDDVACLAWLLAERIGEYGAVEGVPRGGLRLAEAMRDHLCASDALLIVDDVWTTGGSMETHRAGRDAIGGVIFARGPVAPWVTPLFAMTESGR